MVTQGVDLDVGGQATNPIVSIHDQGAGGAGMHWISHYLISH